MRVLVVMLYRGSIVLLPLLVAVTIPMIVRVWYDVTIHGTPWLASMTHSAGDLIRAIEHYGLFAVVIFLVGNLSTFGVLIVTCWVASYYWNAKRVYCVLLCGLASAVGVWMYASHYPAEVEYRISNWPQNVPIPPLLMADTFQYPLYALLGIPIGILIAMLPILRPGRQYWLARGVCPKCQYDLQGKIDKGCPECGWNRHDHVAPTDPDP